MYVCVYVCVCMCARMIEDCLFVVKSHFFYLFASFSVHITHIQTQKLYVETIRRIKKITKKVAKALNITGPFNIQFLSKDNDIKVIECNLRASRSFPYSSKTFGVNFIEIATKAIMGVPVRPKRIRLFDCDYVNIKVPVFSFTRLQGADPTLRVEREEFRT